MSTSTDRTHYRAMVADVAARAKQILPQATNGRLEGAVKLVLLDEVQAAEDGTITVGSCTDPTRTYRLVGPTCTYRLVGPTCTCKDFTEGKAPEGWCRHRIAAGLRKRVREVLAAEASSTPPAPTPLPEAPISITLKSKLHGHDILVTLRGHDFTSVQAQVEQASQWLQSQQPSPAPQGEGKGWCPIHNVHMKLNTGKDGRQWYSHRTDDGFCKGR